MTTGPEDVGYRQRTQLYGNLWYTDGGSKLQTVKWDKLDVISAARAEKPSVTSRVKAIVPRQIKDTIKAALGSKRSPDVNVMDRKV